jgi:nucleoside-diphosphate-sugar epimerase
MVTGSTSTDAQADKRAYYARAKILCDQRLLELHRSERLPVCILRPGLVVGEGTSPFHSGLGFFNNEQHCIGWNQGRNPLPFVLVDDVADAILHACTAKGVEGRCYNIVGDVRPNAREYIAQMGMANQRPLQFHPQSPYVLYSIELMKWVVKAVGRRKAVPPSLRDILSRGLRASFDCSDAKIALGWTPNSDPKQFYEQAF